MIFKTDTKHDKNVEVVRVDMLREFATRMIEEILTHEELTRAKGAYFELVKNQLELGN